MASCSLNGNQNPSSLSLTTSTITNTLVVITPCAACKILRRKCAKSCILAPHFPPNEPLKFIMAHRVFGASNMIKFLQELPESERADAVSSMVYEANARIRDPVYGSAGAIFQLQNQVNELQIELAKAKAKIFNIQYQKATIVYNDSCRYPQTSFQQSFEGIKIDSNDSFQSNNFCLYLDNDQESLWDSVWV